MNYTLVSPGQFVAWITCLIPEYEDVILAGMIKKGYKISPAAQSGQTVQGSKENPSVLISFKIETSNEEMQAHDISKDLIEFLHEKKFYYYSVVVSQMAGSSWYASNITFPKPESKPLPPSTPPLPDSDKNLN